MQRTMRQPHRFYLISICLLALTLAGCMQIPSGLNLFPDPSKTVANWIQKNAIPLQTTDQGTPDTDLAPLQQIVGNANIVGLGEETDGTHEVIDLKARLAEYLITKLGFTTFVMENNWGISQIVNNYINGGSENINEVMSDSLSTAWQTQEYRTLLEWMRAYNANPTHQTKIQFLGMNSNTISQNDLNTVESYIKKVDPQQAAYVQQLYVPITTSSNPISFYDSLNATTKQQYEDQAQQVYTLLQKNQKAYISHSSSQAFALVLQTARVIVQFATLYNYNTTNEYDTRSIQRDSFMAENVEWIHDHIAGNNPKMIIWAHDENIANDPSSEQKGKSLGNYLTAQYKNSYLPIGTTLYQGSFSTYSNDSGTTGTAQIITPLSPSPTYNYTLGQTDLPQYMLDLRKIPAGSVQTWASGPATLNSYGPGGAQAAIQCRLNTMFAVIINIQNSTPAYILHLS